MIRYFVVVVFLCDAFVFVLLAGLVFIIVFVVTAAAAVATVGDVFGACV